MATTDSAKVAVITVEMPKGWKRFSLDVDALDKLTRDAALATNLFVGDQPLFCRSIRHVTRGGEDCLQITVRPACFKIVEVEA